MSEKAQGILALVGRICLSFIFLSSAINKLGNWSGTAGYMASKGMPAIPFFLVMAIIFELLGGLSVLAGFKTRLGALALAVFLVTATLIFHNFWTYQGMDRQMQMINFMKNLSMLGGIFIVASRGPGAISFDEKGG